MAGCHWELFGRTELVHLATRLIIEEGLEAEVRDALDRGYYEHGSEPGGGYRNGFRRGRLKTAEGFIDYSAPQVAGTIEPFRSELRAHLKGRSEALEDLAIEMLARGLSVRDIEDAFKDETGRLLLSKTAVSELGERLWADHQDFATRDLSEYGQATVSRCAIRGINQQFSLTSPTASVADLFSLPRGDQLHALRPRRLGHPGSESRYVPHAQASPHPRA
jgi:hypothetical protein